MADGERSICGSDFVYDFPCMPCEKDGFNHPGVKYCVDCDENLCQTCLAHHSKFCATRRHKVLDHVHPRQGHLKQFPNKRCRKHGGKIIDLYCPNHDCVGCFTYLSADHRLCEGIKFIPEIATAIQTSLEQNQLLFEIYTIKRKLDLLKKRKQKNKQHLEEDRNSMIILIHQVRKQLNSQLDKMENELLSEAEEKFKSKIETINATIAEVDSTLSKMEEAMKQMKGQQHDVDAFIACKLGKQEFQDEFRPKVEELENLLPDHSLELDTDENIQLILEGKLNFASIKIKYDFLNVEYKEEINVRMSDDKNVSKIFAMCSLPDGCLVLSDTNNQKLKKLDPVSYDVSTLINLPGKPNGLCLVDNSCLAVALHNKMKIQFVLLGNPANYTLGHSFPVGDHCRGLSHNDGSLYVCCAGSSVPELHEGRGRIEVYNLEGDLLRCLYEELKFPVHIAVTNDGYDSTMYIADIYIGMQVRGVDGIIKKRFSATSQSDQPFCLIGSKHLCVGKGSTGKVYVFTYTEKCLILEEMDLKGEPFALYFHEKLSRLYISFYQRDFIKIFDI